MIKEPEQFEVQREARPDQLLISTHIELNRSHDYSDDTRYKTEDLKNAQMQWEAESWNPSRSKRSQAEALKISEKLLFEIAYREGTIGLLKEYYDERRA
jgi:hypothetical protein